MMSKKTYELFDEMDSNKFKDFIIRFFDNLGMGYPGHDMEIPLNCCYCPLHRKCKEYENSETTCLEFLAITLKPDEVK